MAHDNSACVFNLIVEKFAEVLHIHFAFAGIDNRCKRIENNFVTADILHGFNNIGKLADTGGFNYNSVGSKLLENLFESLAEVTDKTAADTAGIHLGNFNTGILEEAAVNTDFTEFVFDENKLFTIVAVGDKLFYKCGFARTEET